MSLYIIGGSNSFTRHWINGIGELNIIRTLYILP